jgi:hypothetical protein
VRALLVAIALVLGGCAAQRSNASSTCTDNRSIDAAQQQATLAQCKGEGATAAVQAIPGGPYGVVDRERKEAAVVDACMARNGYIQKPQQ